MTDPKVHVQESARGCPVCARPLGTDEEIVSPAMVNTARLIQGRQRIGAYGEYDGRPRDDDTLLFYADPAEHIEEMLRAALEEPMPEPPPFDPDELVRWAESYGHPEEWAKKAQSLHAANERLRFALGTIMHCLKSTDTYSHRQMGETCGEDSCILCLAESTAAEALR